MARLARVVVPGIPHRVTQRGNRRMPTFLCEEDYQVYLDLMAEWCDKRGVGVWAYCLMPDHVHMIAVPATEQSLRLGVGEAHRRSPPLAWPGREGSDDLVGPVTCVHSLFVVTWGMRTQAAHGEPGYLLHDTLTLPPAGSVMSRLPLGRP